MALNGFLDPVLAPLLRSLGVFWFVFVMSFIVTLITTIVYKYATDQNLMKQLKGEIDLLNKEAKKFMHDQKKAMGFHKQIMEKQMVMMRHSLMSSLITILPIFLLIGWLSGHLAFMPVMADTPFTVSLTMDNYNGPIQIVVPNGISVVGNMTQQSQSTVVWTLTGKTGEYLLQWKIGDKTYSKDVVITSEHKYSDAVKKINDGTVKQIQINYTPQKILNLLGWKLGWLGSYLIFAIIMSMILRKLLKVY